MLVEATAPVTQGLHAVIELLNFLGKPSNPLPDAVELSGMVLVLNNKRDAFYATKANSCSCPSAAYRPGQSCKHQRKYFQVIDAKTQIYSESNNSIKPPGKWPGGFNGPVDLESIKAKTEPSKMGV